MFGNGIIASLNYERQVLASPDLRIHAGVGFCGSEGFNGMDRLRMTLPLGIRYLLPLRNPNHCLDIGAGVTYARADMQVYWLVENRNNRINTHYWSFVPSLSYRVLKKTGWMFRGGLSPVVNTYGFIPFVECSVGKGF